MFLEEDFIEQSTFHERKPTKETRKRLEKGECSRQAEHTDVEVPKYFFRFQELIMASNEALNLKMDKMLVEVEGLKKLLKEKNSQTVEETENKERDDNDGNDGGNNLRNNGEETR